jgi:hypothetical protein
MHPLKAAVLHHNLDEFSALVGDPRVQADLALRKDLLRIAHEMGNIFTIARVARLFPDVESGLDARALLRKQIHALASNWYGGGSPEQAANRMWLQLTEGTVAPFSRDEPDFALSPERKLDIEFLLHRSGIGSEQELLALAKAAGEA